MLGIRNMPLDLVYQPPNPTHGHDALRVDRGFGNIEFKTKASSPKSILEFRWLGFQIQYCKKKPSVHTELFKPIFDCPIKPNMWKLAIILSLLKLRLHYFYSVESSLKSIHLFKSTL